MTFNVEFADISEILKDKKFNELLDLKHVFEFKLLQVNQEIEQRKDHK